MSNGFGNFERSLAQGAIIEARQGLRNTQDALREAQDLAEAWRHEAIKQAARGNVYEREMGKAKDRAAQAWERTQFLDSQIDAWRARFARERNQRRDWQRLAMGAERFIARKFETDMDTARYTTTKESQKDEYQQDFATKIVNSDRGLDQESIDRGEMPENAPVVKFSEGR